jgi:hypothetical protein
MKLRTLAAAAVALLLAGCGSIHPGAAAVVDDTSIPMSRADDVASVYCRLALLSAPGGTPINNADVRRQAVTDLVVGVVAREMAEDANLSPNPHAFLITPAQRKEIAEAVPDDELDLVVDALGSSQRTFAIAEMLGAEEMDDPDAEAEQLREQGLKMIQAEVARRDVRFDPRFGISGDGTQEASTGSLSVPVKEASASDQEGLPATQQCAS